LPRLTTLGALLCRLQKKMGTFPLNERPTKHNRWHIEQAKFLPESTNGGSVSDWCEKVDIDAVGNPVDPLSRNATLQAL